MATILVSGLINVETTLAVERFPIDYSPVRYPFFGVGNTIAGVGYNVAKALTVLGHQVRFLSLIGRDLAGEQAIRQAAQDGIDPGYILQAIDLTPQSVILYDLSGIRQINVDLKDIQETLYPADLFMRALQGCDLAVLCNINFSRGMLQPAQAAGIPVATDVHAINQIDDAYNQDFMAFADILFMSDELLPTSPDKWAWEIIERYRPQVLVIGLGEQGALLSVSHDRISQPYASLQTRPIISTIGAGDALFSGYVHSCLSGDDPYLALQKALVFASWKIGVAGAADGFLNAYELDSLWRRKYDRPGGNKG